MNVDDPHPTAAARVSKLLAALAVALIVWLVTVIGLWLHANLGGLAIEVSGADRIAAYGQLGDYFGGLLNPFFSLLTVAILLATYSEQRKDILTTRRLLKSQIDQSRFHHSADFIIRAASALDEALLAAENRSQRASAGVFLSSELRNVQRKFAIIDQHLHYNNFDPDSRLALLAIVSSVIDTQERYEVLNLAFPTTQHDVLNSPLRLIKELKNAR